MLPVGTGSRKSARVLAFKVDRTYMLTNRSRIQCVVKENRSLILAGIRLILSDQRSELCNKQIKISKQMNYELVEVEF